MASALIREDGNVIGEIRKEGAIFRIWWRARMTEGSGNTHTGEASTNLSFSDARQAVWRQRPNAMIDDLT